MSDPQYPLWEIRLASRLGVSRDALLELRKNGTLLQGEDWEMCSGRVCYAERTVEKVMQHLGADGQPQIPPQSPPEHPDRRLTPVPPEMPQDTCQPLVGCPETSGDMIAQPDAPSAADEVCKSASGLDILTVASSPSRKHNGYHFHNRHLIAARLHSGQLVPVRVRDPRKWRPNRRDGRPTQLEAYNDGTGFWNIIRRVP